MNASSFRWILFLMNPFVSMILAFRDYKLPSAKNIFWAFCAFYGLTFAIATESQGSDINAYVGELQYFFDQSEFGVNEILTYFQLSGEIDVLSTFILYILSRFTDNQGILTMIYAIIFGFFFSRNIWYVLKLLKNEISLIEKLLLLTLVLIIPIWFINGFRMWTAFHMFIYGLLPYIFEKKKIKLIFVFLTFLVHFSYIIPISILTIYLVFGNRISIYFLIFILSFILSELNIDRVNSFVENYAPVTLAERSSAYRNEEKVEQYRHGSKNRTKNIYAVWDKKLLNWSLILLVFYFFLFASPMIKIIPEWKRLFSLNLLFYSAGNILSSFPSGGRFVNIALFLSLIMAILYLNQFKKDTNFKFVTQALTPFFLLFIIVAIRIGFYSLSLTTIFGNPLFAVLNAGDTISLNDLIK